VNKNFWKSGDPFIWLTGGALGFSLLMIVALLWIVAVNALGFFWPDRLVMATLSDGSELMGQVREQEETFLQSGDSQGITYRTQFQVANRDLYGADFRWVDDEQIVDRAYPQEAVYFERLEWGALFGFLTSVSVDGQVVAEGFAQSWQKFQELHPQTEEILHAIHQLERKEIGDISYEMEDLRLAIRGVQTREDDPQRVAERIRPLEQEMASWQQRYEAVAEKLSALYAENARYEIVVQAAGGKEKTLPIAQVSALT
jgi:phosphate transport system permease protein